MSNDFGEKTALQRSCSCLCECIFTRCPSMYV